ncbi:EthD domain-containing protein [Orbus wheelerorum]|uniref:EthD domain-containing protein n=1 Tax=Orbus wheelerorum TaxID=3074111 RepID=UPI00370DC3FC
MIKLIMMVKRRDTLSYEEFDYYWRRHHAIVVSSVKKTLGIIRYVQNVPLEDKKLGDAMRNSRNAPFFDFDGMAEIWWESQGKMIEIRDLADAKKAIRLLLDDENQFIDHTQSLIWYSTERIII